jgi:hypothetical protein
MRRSEKEALYIFEYFYLQIDHWIDSEKQS